MSDWLGCASLDVFYLKLVYSITGITDTIAIFEVGSCQLFVQSWHCVLVETRKVARIISRIMLTFYTAFTFRYNSSLWTLTKNNEKKIATFQRNLIMKILNVKWLRKITTEELYMKKNIVVHKNQAQEINLLWTCSTTTK